jgi:hypothetical protein
MLERPASRRARRSTSPGALRQVQHRQRARDDVRCYQVPVHRTVIETLLDRGLPLSAPTPHLLTRSTD